MLETRQHASEGLIATLSDSPILADNFLDLSIEKRTQVLTGSSFVVSRPRNLRSTREETRTKTTDSLNHYIAERMAELPEVQRVYSKHEQKVFYTWVVITERDQEVQRAIYAREKQIIKRFPEFGFDFYVIYQSGADADSLVSDDVELVYSKR